MSGPPLGETDPDPAPLPRGAHVPAALLGSACVLAWVVSLFAAGPGGMSGWGVSGAGLREGRFGTLFLHMFAHAGLLHLLMNMSVLAAVGGTATSRLGPAPLGWLRFLLLYASGGLAGAALYLALHPAGTVPMLGASGALYGLLGFLLRVPDGSGAVQPAWSPRVREAGRELAKQNAVLFVLVGFGSWSSGNGGGLAWEAHLGGFLFGLLAGPALLPRGAAVPRVAD